MMITCDAIIFDCDGVLFDSNNLKTQAFREILVHYPETVVDEFIIYHKTHGGISRYVKLRHFFTEILEIPVDEVQLSDLLTQFGQACRRLYQEVSLTPGCLTSLAALHNQIPLYVASGSDEAELRQVFRERRLTHFFDGIYGSPKTKSECIAEIFPNLGFATQPLFVGDAESDWQAARQANLPFIFMAGFSDAADVMYKKAQEQNFPIIKTLEELLPAIRVYSSRSHAIKP
jgi:phosphoglycolate phosphatase-like HAD superfamily hydrolase